MLCRTQGVNLADFMFREESNVAIHILDNIAFECACLAHKELHHAAESLLTDFLWSSLASRSALPKKGIPSLQASPRAEPSAKDTLQELSKLVHIHSLVNAAARTASSKSTEHPAEDADFLFTKDLGLDWKIICSKMRRCSAFSSFKSFADPKSCTVNIFYMQGHDVFLKLDVSNESPSTLLRADLIERDRNSGKAQAVLETLANFVLHYLWLNA